MDLDTFLTQLYVLIDDWFKQEFEDGLSRHAGASVRMSDSEVLTVAVAGQWRAGVPWRSERGVVRYMCRQGRGWFPTMLQKSAFNQRVRNLWAVLVRLQQVLAEWLWCSDDDYEVVDCVPLPSCSLAHASRQDRHRLADSSLGHGGTQGGWFFGRQVLLAVSPRGAVHGWLLAHASSDDRWVLEAMLSSRQGQRQMIGPAPSPKQASRQTCPSPDSWSPSLTCGTDWRLPVLADRGFNGARWQAHWRASYGIEVVTAPPTNSGQPWSQLAEHLLSSQRQIIETVFARFVSAFDWRQQRPHSTWGQLTRIAALTAAYNLGLYFNHQLGRPLAAFETLIA
jgi:hypothetical protein